MYVRKKNEQKNEREKVAKRGRCAFVSDGVIVVSRSVVCKIWVRGNGSIDSGFFSITVSMQRKLCEIRTATATAAGKTKTEIRKPKQVNRCKVKRFIFRTHLPWEQIRSSSITFYQIERKTLFAIISFQEAKFNFELRRFFFSPIAINSLWLNCCPF